jgi:stage IV sporulation protein B
MWFFLKATGKNLRYVWLGFGILIGLIAISVSIELLSLPDNLKLSPGEKVTLRVHYPLEFYTKRNLHLPVGSASLNGLLHKRIVLDSKRTDEFDIQLRIFGAIPVKRLHVKFSNPPLVVPGGQAIGVLFSSQGVIIVGHIPVKGIDGKLYYPAKEVGLKVGDIILALNNIPVNRVEDVELILKNYKPGIPGLTLTIKRHNRVNVINIKPVLCMEENYQELRFRLGIFIEDPAAGVGTLTFYDPFTKRFAGLGHHISEFPGAKGLSFQQGEIVYASIHGIKMGAPGEPGEKIGVCSSKSSVIGRIDKNSKFGIFGRLSKNFIDPLAKPIPIAYSSQIKEGQAEIYTVIKGRKVERFKIRIIKVFRQNEPRDKGMVLIVTDPLLLKQTGGIIQGMSGSPIIQDGRLIGAVTHVFVNDPTKGYGVLAEWMNNEINYSIPAHNHHLSPGRQVPINRIPIKERGPIMDRVPIKEKAS